MSSGPWSDAENDRTIASYFAMLAEEVAGRRHSKAAYRHALIPLLQNRPDEAIAFKHRNISTARRAGE